MTANISTGADFKKTDDENNKYTKEFRNYVYSKFSEVEGHLSRKIEREYIEQLVETINARFEEIAKTWYKRKNDIKKELIILGENVGLYTQLALIFCFRF